MMVSNATGGAVAMYVLAQVGAQVGLTHVGRTPSRRDGCVVPWGEAGAVVQCTTLGDAMLQLRLHCVPLSETRASTGKPASSATTPGGDSRFVRTLSLLRGVLFKWVCDRCDIGCSLALTEEGIVRQGRGWASRVGATHPLRLTTCVCDIMPPRVVTDATISCHHQLRACVHLARGGARTTPVRCRLCTLHAGTRWADRRVVYLAGSGRVPGRPPACATLRVPG